MTIDQKAFDVAVESLRPLFREPVSYLEQAAKGCITTYLAALSPPAGDGWRDVFQQALVKLDANCWSLVCKSYPTGGGDADTGYEVISYHMTLPTERIEGSGRTTIEALVSARLLLPAPAGGEDGWVLVPREPTEAMLQAALNFFFDDYANASDFEEDDSRRAIVSEYRAMIAAAPAKGARDE